MENASELLVTVVVFAALIGRWVADLPHDIQQDLARDRGEPRAQLSETAKLVQT
jgi:hypothetical protein